MRAIRFSAFLFALAATAIQAEPVEDGAILLERQAPGTPQFQCHSDCGNALAGGRNPTHCDNATWTGLYEACLGCALTFDIWKHYGQGLTGAASACSLTPTPLPSGAASSSIGASIPTSESTAVITSSPTTTTASESAAPAAATSTTATSAASGGLSAGQILGFVFWVTAAFGIQVVL